MIVKYQDDYWLYHGQRNGELLMLTHLSTGKTVEAAQKTAKMIEEFYGKEMVDPDYKVEEMQDGEGRNYVEDALVVGDEFQGAIWRESEAMPDEAANAYPMIFGDLSGYAIVERLGMAVQRYNDSNTGINVVEFHIRRRLGGDLIEDYKFAVNKCSTT